LKILSIFFTDLLSIFRFLTMVEVSSESYGPDNGPEQIPMAAGALQALAGKKRAKVPREDSRVSESLFQAPLR
jgi:hypothetical protein